MKLLNAILVPLALGTLLLWSFTHVALAVISITVTGDWVKTVDKNDLTAGVGSDLQSTYTSVSSQVSIDISGTTGAGDTWRVDVRRIDSTWNGSFHLYVQRTTSGTGPGSASVSGGTSYQEVTVVDASFFSGEDDVTGIKAQVQLSGVSVQISPAFYSATVQYTVFDT